MDLSTDVRRAELDDAKPPFWLTPAAYWMPAHLPISAWHTHGPFAAWLVDVLRPRSIAELGTHYGYSCFAFAEATKRLGLDTTVSALDTWEGDDFAGRYGEEVFDYVTSVARTDYPDTVRLLRGWFSQSRSRFEDASIDLLHIDGRHAYEDVVGDYSEWSSAVRDGGVILFHDTAEREKGFGVWRLWEEIAEPGRSFTFEHGHGLGVLAVGEVSLDPLRALFTADEATAARIRDDFSRLGDLIARQVWLESLPGELDRAWAEARSRATHEDQLEAVVASQRDYIEALKTSTSWRVTAPLRAVGKLRPHRD
ncbi:MAG: class I SAM-dependent methyltransferase [Microbacterium sp.]